MLVIAAALPDLFDGALAKASGTSSQRGAFFDSTVDRITDAMLLGGIAWYLADVSSPHAAILPFAVSSVASVISYQRAKAESLGLDAKGGLMERAERIVLLCIGLLLEAVGLGGSLTVILWGMLIL
ncbi:MAG: CDP-alcohol phosphatidyltransferase family protein, partial [Ilumatobacter sp.]